MGVSVGGEGSFRVYGCGDGVVRVMRTKSSLSCCEATYKSS
jgi:hypothetical protein